jgi:calcineurin-like phosphoesterase family protein
MLNENTNSRVWFSSDYHFEHANIIKYCKRPFEDVNEMRREIICRHNEVVKKTDLVFCLGDISFNHSLDHLHKMNGTFIIIKGNHDDKNVKKISPKEMILSYYKVRLLLVHKPLSIYGNFDLNVCGHVHEKWKYREDINALNVGVDVWDFYPVPLDEVLKYCK